MIYLRLVANACHPLHVSLIPQGDTSAQEIVERTTPAGFLSCAHTLYQFGLDTSVVLLDPAPSQPPCKINCINHCTDLYRYSKVQIPSQLFRNIFTAHNLSHSGAIHIYTDDSIDEEYTGYTYTSPARPGRSLHVVTGDTCLQQVYERPSHIPVLFGGRGQSAALGHSPSGFAYHIHTNTPTHASHTASPVGSNLGALGRPPSPSRLGGGSNDNNTSPGHDYSCGKPQITSIFTAELLAIRDAVVHAEQSPSDNIIILHKGKQVNIRAL